MFKFFLKQLTLSQSGLFNGTTDYHSHLLSGVDDGVKCSIEACDILSEMEHQGIRKVWLTPHIMEEVPNNTLTLKERFERLKSLYVGKVELNLAAEYMLDNLFEKRLQANNLLPLEVGDKRYLLVETSCFSPPIHLQSTLKRIQAKGYYPLLAHPERYAYMTQADYDSLKEERVAFQLNLPSLVGMYGKQVQKKAVHLLKAGMYDLTGNDIHSLSSFNALLKAPIERRSRDMLSECFRASHNDL